MHGQAIGVGPSCVTQWEQHCCLSLSFPGSLSLIFERTPSRISAPRPIILLRWSSVLHVHSCAVYLLNSSTYSLSTSRRTTCCCESWVYLWGGGWGLGGGGGDTVDREDGELNDSERRRLGAGVTKMPNHVNLHVLSSNLRRQPPRSNLLFIVSLVVLFFLNGAATDFLLKKKNNQGLHTVLCVLKGMKWPLLLSCGAGPGNICHQWETRPTVAPAGKMYYP